MRLRVAIGVRLCGHAALRVQEFIEIRRRSHSLSLPLPNATSIRTSVLREFRLLLEPHPYESAALAPAVVESMSTATRGHVACGVLRVDGKFAWSHRCQCNLRVRTLTASVGARRADGAAPREGTPHVVIDSSTRIRTERRDQRRVASRATRATREAAASLGMAQSRMNIAPMSVPHVTPYNCR
jgi:hypothetical protein